MSFSKWYETVENCDFGDELGYMGAAFEAGQQSRQDEIEVLKKQIAQLESLLYGEEK